MRRLLFALPLLALLGFGAVVLWRGFDRDPDVRPDALVGQPLPSLTLPRLDGHGGAPLRWPVRGPYIVNVFASWCGPCEIEHPQLMALGRAGLPIVGLAHRDEPADSRAFLARLGDPFALTLTDREGRAGIELGVSAVPETFLVGADGLVIDKVSGPLTNVTRARLLETARRGRR